MLCLFSLVSVLGIPELRVEIPEEVVEKHSPILICKTTCNLSNKATFLWYKNGKPLSELSGRNELLLQSVSSDDTGNYSCAVRDQEHLPSPDVTLSVRYPPKNVSVSVSPSVIVEGDSVTLSCSSDSNPPALNFSWFKGGTSLQSGDTYRITNIESEASGTYQCSAGNKHGSQFSAPVTVNVMCPPKSVSVSVSPSVIVEGDSVTLSCSSDSNPPALNFSWFKENQTSAVGSGQSFSISSFSSSSSGRFYCEAQNKYGSQRSASVSLTVKAEESVRQDLIVTVGITAAVVMTVILMLVVWLLIRRKRATPSEEQNPRGSRVATVESLEDSYITLEPKSRCSEYDTLDNMKRSCDTDDPEDQDSTYYNMDK